MRPPSIRWLGFVLGLFAAGALGSPTARAQSLLPTLQAEPVLALSDEPRDRLVLELEAREEGFQERLNRLEGESRWQLERLEAQRTALLAQEKTWRDRRIQLRGAGPQRRMLLEELLEESRRLDGLLRDIEESYDTRLRVYLGAMSEARQLRLDLENPKPEFEDPTTAEIDGKLQSLSDSLEEADGRVSELETSLAGLEEGAEEIRRELDAARLEMLRVDELPPSMQTDPDDAEAVGEPERELAALVDEEARLSLAILDRRYDLARGRVALLELQIEEAGLTVPVLALLRSEWSERRAEAASRESDGIFAVTEPLLTSEILTAGLEHTQELLASPSDTLQQVGERLAVASQERAPVGRGLLVLLGLCGVLMVVFVGRVLPLLAPAQADDPKPDSLGWICLRATLPVLPVSIVCSVLILLDAVSEPLRPLYRFSAVAPPVTAVVLSLAAGLFPVGGSRNVSVSVARYLRRLIRFGAVLACIIGVTAALVPLFGYPAEVYRVVQSALLLWLLIGWLGILLRREEVLSLLGAQGDVADVGVLRAGVRRFYRFFVLGPVAVYVLHGVGYANLARLLVRGGLVTLGVFLLAPWLLQRLRVGAALLLGYPEGGGWFALGPEAARTAYRSVAPVLLLVVGCVSLALLASGWDYSGDVFGNLALAVTHPLLEIGGSNITGLSLVLLAVTTAATFLAMRWLLGVLQSEVYPFYDLDRGTQATLDTLTRYVMLAAGVVLGLKVVGVGVGALAVFAGVVGVAVGFGSQTLAANFIAGLFLLLGRRVSVGDVVELDGVVGRVMKISGYATNIRTLDNLMIVVPNSKLIDGTVVNWTVDRSPVRISVAVGVAYGSDVAQVRRLLLQAGADDPRVLVDPAPMVRFDDFGDSALAFTLQPWVDDPDQRFVIASDLRFRIDRAFREHDIEISFPQQDVHLRMGDGSLRVALERGFSVRDEDGERVDRDAATVRWDGDDEGSSESD